MNLLGIVAVVGFTATMLLFAILRKEPQGANLRRIPAFSRLVRGIGLAVETGQRIHLSLGRGGVFGLPGAATLLGLSVLNRVGRTAAVSDLAPIATSGEGVQAILSQDSLKAAHAAVDADIPMDPASGRLVGLTPFSFAAGALPVIYDQQVSVNILAGSFGAEIALLLDAADRSGSQILAGSENLAAQAIIYSALPDPLVGEELFAAGAYLAGGSERQSSLIAQDVFRILLIGAMIVGAVLKLVDVW